MKFSRWITQDIIIQQFLYYRRTPEDTSQKPPAALNRTAVWNDGLKYCINIESNIVYADTNLCKNSQ